MKHLETIYAAQAKKERATTGYFGLILNESLWFGVIVAYVLVILQNF